ncbi:MAG: peptide chain release factor N(5)-glutamine methyltransferase [Crocinitomicaceae bacterium]
MFVTANNFKAIRSYFSDELSGLYDANEIRTILKYLFIKRFNADAADFIFADEKLLSESDLLFFRQALKRLQNNEPFQYVVGETEFYGLTFICDQRALIPRPETEELVDWILSNHAELGSIMDLCSGSGCIALALKANRLSSQVYAVEFSDEAIEQLNENKVSNNLNVNLLKGDALSDYNQYLNGEKLDLIVSNPPYIPQMDRSIMHANVLEYEPEMALFVDNDDPLLFYREILQRSHQVLNENGWVYFEIHEDLGEQVVALFEQSNFVNIELRKDLQGKDRMMRGQVVTCVHERDGS